MNTETLIVKSEVEKKVEKAVFLSSNENPSGKYTVVSSEDTDFKIGETIRVGYSELDVRVKHEDRLESTVYPDGSIPTVKMVKTMNAETLTVKARIDGNLGYWLEKIKLFYTRESLAGLIEESLRGWCNDTHPTLAAQLVELAMNRVDIAALADYLLENIDSVAIEDWPQYTWGVVAKTSDSGSIVIGNRISVCGNTVVVAEPHLNFHSSIGECEGTRVKELNNES